ncbi:lysozyme C, milk isozyme-like [Chiloscyllium plagiosum]|uniref:lysozyme C, milk isozyme-like n=1 Tax=Chiloscyllium plagiosum TaxID=36176 RepID=UPI001CB7F1ED|nr:lysozyme C, milk isozyme-like [Chiloscyllium plagiosum]XP_043557548.1 lysozyme C, milk isozyme-like [Chiloscyllium plagiosum]
MKILIVLSVLLTLSSAKVLSRCELARVVKNSILSEFPKYSVADWVCMAHYESRYNTLAKYYERGNNGEIQSGDYGIFQISSKWWCSDTMFPEGPNGCNMNCNLFLQDSANIEADISCAAIIVNQQGMEAWKGWTENCKGKWINYYTYFCFW